MKKPNIVFVMADQMTAKALPFYGHSVVKAPTLSRLAEEGVVFENAYCNSPLCGPSRTSMMTGLLPSKAGGYDNAHELSSALPTFAHYMRLGGYLTCLSGKMHFTGPDQLHGFEERLTTDIYPSDFGWTPNWGEPEKKVTFQNMKNVLETGPCVRSLQIDYDDDVSTKACGWLYDRARNKSEQPFMLTVSFTSPHDPYVARPEHWDLYTDEEIDLPKVPSIPIDQMDVHSKRIRTHYSIDKAKITDEDIRRARHGYYASIEYIDAKVAGLMQVLKETGLSKNTLVVFASDHGDMMGERGLYYKKTFFEWSSRVPLIFWADGQLNPQRISETVSLLDILPTFVDLAGTTEDMIEADGASLIPLLKDESLGPRIIPGEFLSEGVFEPTFMLVRGRLKLFYSENDPSMLFDLGADPDELTNLSDDPNYAQAMGEMLEEARATWDASALKIKIVKDQDRRRLIDRSHKIGKPPVWDFQPHTDASKQYVRAGKWTTEVEAGAHLDPLKDSD